MTTADLWWGVWVEWSAPDDWTTRDAALRVLDTIKAVGETYPGRLDSFTVGGPKGTAWTVDTDGVAERIAGAMVSKRRGGGEPFGDVHLILFPSGPDLFSIGLSQLGAGARYTGSLKVDFYVIKGAGAYLTPVVPPLVARLAHIWSARNAWVDMVHVRQEWNHWRQGQPVYGWATWLRRDFVTVDPTGLDVDVTPDGDGTLLVLRVDPLAMGDKEGEVGRGTIDELISRTVREDV